MRTAFLLIFWSSLLQAQVSYDLRQYRHVSSPKKQSWGTCWAFASIASMESNLLIEKNWPYPGEPDLSEYHMDKFSGFTRIGSDDHVHEDWYSGQGSRFPGSNTDDRLSGLLVHAGGDYKVAVAYLSNIGGAVEEFKTPAIGHTHNYHKEFGDLPTEGVLLKNNYRYFHPNSVEWLTHGTFEENIARIKDSIKAHGSVGSSQYMQHDPHEVSLSGEEIHFYYGSEEPTHAVNLIGWDDERVVVPFRPGVWFVQDSDHYDEVSGHIGYFITPYYDVHTGQHPEFGGVSFRGVKERKFKNIYSHSLHGWQYEFFAGKVANKYYLQDEIPTHVGTYTVAPDDSIIVFVKDSVGNLLCYSSKETKENPGYYLIPLLCQEDAFNSGLHSIEVETTSGLYAHDGTKVYKPLLGAMPKQGEPLVVGSSATRGESFYFRNGEWLDLYDYRWESEIQYGIQINKTRTSNFSINLFTKSK